MHDSIRPYRQLILFIFRYVFLLPFDVGVHSEWEQECCLLMGKK